MNKTVTINISGIVFHIEEDAYEKLGSYLKTIANKFTVEEGRDEIMMDIEARVAEILQQKLGPSKQVVLMTNVDYVISLMGEPEVISDKDEKKEDQSAKAETSNYNTSKRLYRDADDKIIGGVCSGLGHYFNIDRVWIRIAFAVAFFFFGTGFFFYILLLIIIPKAETTAEKLEMHGEPVDVNNISRSIKEEFSEFGKKAENFADEMKSRGKKFTDDIRERTRKNKIRSGFDDFFQRVFYVIGRVLGFAFIFFGILFLIGLLTSTFALSDFAPETFGETMRGLFPDGFHYFIGIAAFFLVFGVPILMMIYKGIRILFNITAKHHAVGITALSLWVIGIILVVISIFGISKGFSEDERVHENFIVQNPHMQTLRLSVNIDHDMENDNYNSKWNRKYRFARRWKFLSVDGEEVKFGYPDLQIVPSENDSIQLIVYKYASGAERRDALERAKAIDYKIVQKDSLFTFNSFFTIGENQHWRAQHVRMELRVPIGTTVFLTASMKDLLDDVDNLSNAIPEDMVDRSWKMTTRGLQCMDCAGLETQENQKSNESAPAKSTDSIKVNSR